MSGLMIGTCAFPSAPFSTANEPGARREENFWSARDTLDRLRRAGPPAVLLDELQIEDRSHWFVVAAQHVAPYFDVRLQELIRAWLDHYGPTDLSSLKAWVKAKERRKVAQRR